MNEISVWIKHLQHPLLLAFCGLLVVALLLHRAEKQGRLPYLLFLIILLVMAVVIAGTWNSSHPSIEHVIALLSVAASAVLAWKPANEPSQIKNPAEGIQQYEERLRIVEQQLLALQVSGTVVDDKGRHELEQKLKAVQGKLDNLQQSYEEKQRLLEDTSDKLKLVNSLLPDEQLKKAEESLAQGDTKEAEQAFDAVAEKEGEIVALAAYQSGKLAEDRLDYAKAMRQYKKAVALEEDNPDYLLAAGNMAKTLGDYAQAQELLERLLRIRQEEGEESIDLAEAQNDLAGVYQDQGNYAEAKPLYQRALEIYEQKLGKNHPHVATALNNLALLYKAREKYSEAEPLFKRALKIVEQKLGEDHPNVAATLNNLAALYKAREKYSEAEPLYNRVLMIFKKSLGKDYPSVAITLNNLAELYRAQGRYEEAEPLYQRALSILKAKLPANHPHIKTVQKNYDALKEKMAQAQ